MAGTAGTRARAARGGAAAPPSCRQRGGRELAVRPRCSPPIPPPIPCGMPPTTCFCHTAPVTCGRAQEPPRIPEHGLLSPGDSSCKLCSPTFYGRVCEVVSSWSDRVPEEPASCSTRTPRGGRCACTASASPPSPTPAGSSIGRRGRAVLRPPPWRVSATHSGEETRRTRASATTLQNRGSATSGIGCIPTSGHPFSCSNIYSIRRNSRRKGFERLERDPSGTRCTVRGQQCGRAFRVCARRSPRRASLMGRWLDPNGSR